MPAIQMPMTILMADGTTHDVMVDQRDVGAFETQPFGRPFKKVDEVIFTFMRWTAWHAITREREEAGSTWMTWKDFDKKCVEVTDQNQGDEEEQKVDPTIPAASADI